MLTMRREVKENFRLVSPMMMAMISYLVCRELSKDHGLIRSKYYRAATVP